MKADSCEQPLLRRAELRCACIITRTHMASGGMGSWWEVEQPILSVELRRRAGEGEAHLLIGVVAAPVVLGDLGEDLGRVALKRRAAGDHLVQQHPEPPPVRGCGPPFALEQLRRHVPA